MRLEDAGQPLRGITTAESSALAREKLYIYMGDNGRRGQMQNLPDGPGCTNPPCIGFPPATSRTTSWRSGADNAHLTGDFAA